MPKKFNLGDKVSKTKGSSWTGHVVGTYSTALTPEGYCIESCNEPGSVQIYPAAALALVEAATTFPDEPTAFEDRVNSHMLSLPDSHRAVILRSVPSPPYGRLALPVLRDGGATRKALEKRLICDENGYLTDIGIAVRTKLRAYSTPLR